MTKKVTSTLIAIAALAFASVGLAGSLKVEPGLWKSTITTSRKGKSATPHTSQRCVTQQDIDDFGNKLGEQHYSPQANCQRTSFKETSNSVDFKYECTGQFTLTSQGSIKFDSPTHYMGTITVNGNVMGHPMDNSTTMEGTRVGACTGNEGGAN